MDPRKEEDSEGPVRKPQWPCDLPTGGELRRETDSERERERETVKKTDTLTEKKEVVG